MKVFYSHLLVNYGELAATVESLEISRPEKSKALELINQTIHHGVVDAILEYIDERHHGRILTRIAAAPDDPGILDLVNQLATDDIEMVLRKRIAAMHLDLMEDLLGGG